MAAAAEGIVLAQSVIHIGEAALQLPVEVRKEAVDAASSVGSTPDGGQPHSAGQHQTDATDTDYQPHELLSGNEPKVKTRCWKGFKAVLSGILDGAPENAAWTLFEIGTDLADIVTDCIVTKQIWNVYQSTQSPTYLALFIISFLSLILPGFFANLVLTFCEDGDHRGAEGVPMIVSIASCDVFFSGFVANISPRPSRFKESSTAKRISKALLFTLFLPVYVVWAQIFWLLYNVLFQSYRFMGFVALRRILPFSNCTSLKVPEELDVDESAKQFQVLTSAVQKLVEDPLQLVINITFMVLNPKGIVNTANVVSLILSVFEILKTAWSFPKVVRAIEFIQRNHE